MDDSRQMDSASHLPSISKLAALSQAVSKEGYQSFAFFSTFHFGVAAGLGSYVNNK